MSALDADDAWSASLRSSCSYGDKGASRANPWLPTSRYSRSGRPRRWAARIRTSGPFSAIIRPTNTMRNRASWAADACDRAIRGGGEPLAIDAVAHDSNPFGESPGEGGTRTLGERLADADDRRDAVEHPSRLTPRVRAQEVVVRVQHDPMPRVAQQPREHRGVVREHERRLARTDRLGDGLVEPRNGGARESDPSAGEVDHAFPSRGAPRAGVLDDRRAGVSRPHGRAIEHDEVPKGRALTACRSGESVDHGRDRRAGAGREVVAGGDGVEDVGHEFPAVFRIRATSATGALRTRQRVPSGDPELTPSPGRRNGRKPADWTVCRISAVEAY